MTTKNHTPTTYTDWDDDEQSHTNTRAITNVSAYYLALASVFYYFFSSSLLIFVIRLHVRTGATTTAAFASLVSAMPTPETGSGLTNIVQRTPP
jgi:hypothetical protein